MTKRRWKIALIGLLLTGALGCRSDGRPDIVLVTFDTLRRDHVGAYGSGLGVTPNLDALAERSLVFDAAFTTMPTTGPAHASLFTGLLPYQHGVRHNAAHVSRDVATTRGLPRLLRDHGYTTACFTTSPVFGLDTLGFSGFDHRDLPTDPLRTGIDAVDAALAWLDADPGQPVFVWVHLYDAHSPYGAASEKIGGYPIDLDSYGWVQGTRFARQPVRQKIAAAYARGVADADAALGRLVAGVAERRTRPTQWIAVSDHGEFLDELLESDGYAYDHGALLRDPVLRIPLLIAGPGIEPGRAKGAVSIRDLYTTLLQIAEIRDSSAGEEGRLDLRFPSDEPRIVLAERRVYAFHQDALARWGPEVSRKIRRNAVAAMDGEHLVVAGEDGAPSLGDGAPERLLRLARDVALASFAEDGAGKAEVDAQTREMLRGLGYVD